MTQRTRATKSRISKASAKVSESQLQRQCVQWFRIQFPKQARLLFAIPNGARLYGSKVDRAKQWNKLVAEGAVAGAADLFLSIPAGELAGLYIEMKTPRGKQSDVQKGFEASVIEAGYGYALPRSFEEFRRVVLSYLASGTY